MSIRLKVSLVLVGLTLSAAVSSAQTMGSMEQNLVRRDTSTNLDKQLLNDERARREVAFFLAPIKSADDLARYMKNLSPDSPLARLSSEGRQRFVESVTFNEAGITGYYFGDLEAELNITDSYKILSLFGAQHTISLLNDIAVTNSADEAILSFERGRMPAQTSMVRMGSTIQGGPNGQDVDYPGYRCEERATCMESFKTICMHTC